jgi:hypothetical protein
MRAIHALPLMAAFVLAACGGDADENGDGKLSGSEVAAEAEGMAKPLPGQYRTSAELLEFDVPGAPDALKEQMRAGMASGLAQGNTTCLTPEDAEKNGARQMVENLAESNCEMKTFNVSGSNIAAVMECSGADGGMKGTVSVEGQINPDSSTMTLTSDQETPAGKTHFKMRMNSQRIGDCAG